MKWHLQDKIVHIYLFESIFLKKNDRWHLLSQVIERIFIDTSTFPEPTTTEDILGRASILLF